jgi:hypothetical protein
MEHILALLLLAAAWLLFAGPLFWSPGNLYMIDTMLIDLPDRLHAARLWRGGHFPFWTSLLECGFPLFYDGQAGMLYPFFFLYLISPTPEMHDAFMALHYAIAAGAMYAFLAGHGLRPLAACVGAAAYFGGPPMQATHVVAGIPQTMCWLPLALLFIDRFAAGRRRALWWCAVINAPILLTACPNVALMCFTVELAYLGWVVLRERTAMAMIVAAPGPRRVHAHVRGALRHLKVFLSASAIMVGIAVALTMVQLLPTLQYFANSNRSQELGWDAVYHNRAVTLLQIFTVGVADAAPLKPSYAGYLAAGMLALVAVRSTWPKGWRGTLLIGLLLCLLAVDLSFGVAALVLGGLIWNRGDARFWIVLLGLSLLAAMATPVLWPFYYLPPFSWFRWPNIYLLISLVAYCVLMAIGADDVLNRVGRALPSRTTAWRLVVGAALTAPVVFLATNQSMAMCLAPPGWYQQASPAILRAARQAGHFRLLPLIYGRVEGKKPETPQRYWPVERMRTSALMLSPNYNLLHGVAVSVQKNQFDSVTPAEMTHLVASDRHISNGYLQVAAITHIADIVPLERHLRDATELISPAPVRLYRLKDPQPRAWMVYQARRIDDPHQRVRAINSPDFDAKKVAIVETDVALPGPPATPPRVAWHEPAPASLVVDVESQRAGLLVVADMYATSLVATIDGQPAPLLKANHAFRGVLVPAGRHRVEMWFRPTAFYVGSVVSCLTLAVVVFRLARDPRRPGRRPMR